MLKIIILLLSLFSFLSSWVQTARAVECPSEGGVLPEITLSVPQDVRDKDYLGITGTGSFSLSDIKADLVVLEIFSMYCPFCQKEAPVINNLFKIINDDPKLKNRIKIIGIGAGNSSFEVGVFKNTYDIPFPLFPDESFSVHKVIGEVRTPYFFVYEITPDGSNRIIYSRAGSIRDPRQFLDLIIKKSGSDREG